jgi:hypothetical protein
MKKLGVNKYFGVILNINWLMLKRVLIIILVTASTQCALGQTDIKELNPYKHQIGINTTLFIKQFLSFSDNNIMADNPYLFTYKYIGNKGTGLRTGLGFSFVGNKNSSNGNVGLVPDSTDSRFYFRVGYEKQFVLSKHWIAYGGIDVRYQTEKTKVVTTVSTFPQNQVSTISNKNLNIGLGPVLGFEFIINKRMSLNAEATVIYFYNEQRKKIEDSRFPALNSDSYTSRSLASISVPTTLFFIVKL